MRSIALFFIVGFCSFILKVRPYFDIAMGKAVGRLVRNKGRNCTFEGQGIILAPDRLNLGDHVSIGRNFFIRADGGIRIGSFTHISRNVVIHTANHNVGGDALPYDRDDRLSPVDIGDYVWIGMNVNILPGVTIGDGAIIGMGTTVSRDVGAGEIVVGAAQRVVGHRDKEHTDLLVSQGKFLANGSSRNRNAV